MDSPRDARFGFSVAFVSTGREVGRLFAARHLRHGHGCNLRSCRARIHAALAGFRNHQLRPRRIRDAARVRDAAPARDRRAPVARLRARLPGFHAAARHRLQAPGGRSADTPRRHPAGDRHPGLGHRPEEHGEGCLQRRGTSVSLPLSRYPAVGRHAPGVLVRHRNAAPGRPDRVRPAVVPQSHHDRPGDAGRGAEHRGRGGARDQREADDPLRVPDERAARGGRRGARDADLSRQVRHGRHHRPESVLRCDHRRVQSDARRAPRRSAGRRPREPDGGVRVARLQGRRGADAVPRGHPVPPRGPARQSRGTQSMSGTQKVGLALGFPALRVRHHYLAFATLGFNVLVYLVLRNEEWLTGGTFGISGIRRPTLFGLSLDGSAAFFYFTYAATIALALLFAWLIRSPWGRAFAALRDNPIRAESLGVNIVAYTLLAFAIGAACAGIAGAY